MSVRPDACPRIERHAGSFETDPVDERRSPDGDEHEIALDRLALAEMHDEPSSGVLDLRALLAEMDDDAAPRERLPQLTRRVRILLRDERLEHLDHRHLGAEALEDRGELAADDPAAENDEAPRYLGLGEQAGRVHAARRLETGDRRHDGLRSRRDDRALETEADLTLVEGEGARILEAGAALEPGHVVGLEERGHAAGHLLDDLMPSTRSPGRNRARARRRRRRASGSPHAPHGARARSTPRPSSECNQRGGTSRRALPLARRRRRARRAAPPGSPPCSPQGPRRGRLRRIPRPRS